MPKEIERKFLVNSTEFKNLGRGVLIRQGFLNSDKERVVRIRIIEDKAFITIKGLSTGSIRSEFEYEIPIIDAEVILNELCEKPIIEKFRYKINSGNFVWEVDEFRGLNEGLIIAEIELVNENQTFDFPDWIGKEVTDDPRYYNSNLVRNPFTKWK